MSLAPRSNFFLLNGIELFGLLSGWIGTITAFGAGQHVIGGIEFWWNDAKTSIGASHYPSGSKCNGTGAAYCAFMVLSFICLTLALFFMTVRICHAGFSGRALRGELITYALGFLFYFIAVPIWSGCLAESQAAYGTANYKAYAWVIAAEFLLFLGAIPLFFIMRDVSAQNVKGNGTTMGTGFNNGITTTTTNQPAVMV